MKELSSPSSMNGKRKLTFLKVVVYSIKNAFQQIHSTIPTYCLGIWTCFVAITIAATMHSILEHAPVTYLASAEMEMGQLDISIFPSSNIFTSNKQVDYVNYTKCESKLFNIENGEGLYNSPRFEISGSANRKSNTWNGKGKGEGSKVSIFAIDIEREKKAGIGRQWNLPPLNYKDVYITEKMATILGVEIGDTFDVNIDLGALLSKFGNTPSKNTTEYFTNVDLVTKAFKGCRNFGCNCNKQSISENQCLLCGTANDGTKCGLPQTRRVTVVLKGAIKFDWGGKIGSYISDAMFMEYKYLFNLIWNEGLSTPASVRMDFSAAFKNYGIFPTAVLQDGYHASASIAESSESADLFLLNSEDAKIVAYQYATKVIVMLPPFKRNNIYIQQNYNSIQDDLVYFASKIINAIGATDALSFEAPVTSDLRNNRFTSMYLALMLNVLISILTVLSIILIYSLLMINVQKRTFEIAIRRMLGTRREHVIVLLGTQALSYSVPALLVGMPFGHFLTSSMMYTFSKQVGINIVGGLTFRGIFYGLLLGALIPVIASIGPISLALKTKLINAMDAKRPKIEGVKFSIIYGNQDGKLNFSLIIVGFCLTLFGFIVYYFLPLALLSFNVTIFGSIFLFILLGMLFGLAILSLNLERSVEFSVMFVFFRCCVNR